MKKLWIIMSPDMYNGYGTIAVGDTEQHAKDVFMEAYRKNCAYYTKELDLVDNKYTMGSLKTFEDIEDYYGVRIKEIESGKTYSEL